VGIIHQPDWQSQIAFMQLGKPNLSLRVAAGNMDSMINRYTADRKIARRAYTPGGKSGSRRTRPAASTASAPVSFQGRPRASAVSQASTARIAPLGTTAGQGCHSLLLDAKADILLYGQRQRAGGEIAPASDRGETFSRITDIRVPPSCAAITRRACLSSNSTRIDRPG